MVEGTNDPPGQGRATHAGDDDIFGQVSFGMEGLIARLDPGLVDLMSQTEDRVVDPQGVFFVSRRLIKK